MATVSRSALRHNTAVLRAAAGVPLCAMVKADAYGHGAALVTTALADAGIAFWGVATLEEALRLRAAGVREPILALCPLEPCLGPAAAREQADLMADAGIRATLAGSAGLALLEAWGRRRRGRRPLRVHLKVDTGMHRSGCPWASAVALAGRAAAAPGLALEGVFSHFAGADLRDLASARRQAARFRGVLAKLAARGVRVPIRHLANSAAIFTLPDTALDMARPGIALYGYVAPGVRGAASLRPALRLEVPVVLVKRLPRGAACGYGGAFVARRPARLGLLPIGYADGYDRRWSNRGVVSAGRRRMPVVGRVSMDLTLVDLTDAPEVGPGTVVTVISADPRDPHAAGALARRLGTLPHEVFCALGARVRRVLEDGPAPQKPR